MTSPTYEEQAKQFNELMEIARRSYDPLYREEVLHALLAMGTKFEESQAKLAAAEEAVRIYAEAVRAWVADEWPYGTTWDLYGNETEVFPSAKKLRDLAASLPDGTSALSEVAKLRGLLEKAVPHISRSIFNPTNNDDWYGSGMRLQEEIRAAMGERSTSPEPRTYIPASLDRCVCGRRYFEHVTYRGREGVFCPGQGTVAVTQQFRPASPDAATEGAK